MEFPIKSLSDMERLSHQVKWQYFEKLVAFIFEKNEFDAKQNVVVRTINGKRQFDVIASKYEKAYLVECKKWRGRTQKKASLESAVRKHLERCEAYELSNMAGSQNKIFPLIVTLLEDDIAEYENVPIVPVMKLDWFLNNES